MNEIDQMYYDMMEEEAYHKACYGDYLVELEEIYCNELYKEQEKALKKEEL